MHPQPKILTFSGSSRTPSFNKLLARQAAEFAKSAGAEVTFIDLRDFPMPIYDGDLEAASGLPENAKKLKALFLAHDGLLIASPEYNSSLTSLLKNSLDWVSRPSPGEAPLAAFQSKTAALLSASPGALGGLRGLVHLRAILTNIGVLVLPDQLAVSKAHEAFDANGALLDPKQRAALERIAKQLVTTTAKLAS